MPSIEKCQSSILRIEFGIKKCDEPIRWNAFDQITIDGVYGLHQRIVYVALRVHGRMQRRHQKRGGRSLARHVAQRNYHAAVSALNEVVVIAADFVAGKTDALQLVS